LTKLLGAILSSGKKISKVDQDQIAVVEKDIEIKMRVFSEVAAGEAPPRWPEVMTIVKTLKGKEEINGLRIHYAPEALKDQVEGEGISAFGRLSSPSNQQLPEADYCFWAAEDQDVGKSRVTEKLCQELRINREPQVIELKVK
jgi:hypothetical protein